MSVYVCIGGTGGTQTLYKDMKMTETSTSKKTPTIHLWNEKHI
jgi:hypothetical protein